MELVAESGLGPSRAGPRLKIPCARVPMKPCIATGLVQLVPGMRKAASTNGRNPAPPGSCLRTIALVPPNALKFASMQTATITAGESVVCRATARQLEKVAGSIPGCAVDGRPYNSTRGTALPARMSPHELPVGGRTPEYALRRARTAPVGSNAPPRTPKAPFRVASRAIVKSSGPGTGAGELAGQ